MSREEDAAIVTVGPVGDAAAALLADDFASAVGIEIPFQFAGCGVERDEAKLRRGGVEDAIDDERLALHFGAGEGVAGFVGPGDLKLRDVGTIDLLEGGVVRIVSVDGEGEQGGERRDFLNHAGSNRIIP